MSDKLRVLEPVSAPDPDIIAMFEDYLERAKAGEFCAAGIACATPAGFACTGITVSKEQLTLRAAVCVLSARLDKQLLEQAGDD